MPLENADLDRLLALARAAEAMTGDDPGKVDVIWRGTDVGLALLRAITPQVVLDLVAEVRRLRAYGVSDPYRPTAEVETSTPRGAFRFGPVAKEAS